MIINLTQHPATPEQIADGVVEPQDKARVRELLNFTELPLPYQVEAAAEALAQIARASGCDRAMIGGAPFFMAPLGRHLAYTGVQPVFAFSLRESEEVAQPDGSVKKVAVFRHIGFYEHPTV